MLRGAREKHAHALRRTVSETEKFALLRGDDRNDGGATRACGAALARARAWLASCPWTFACCALLAVALAWTGVFLCDVAATAALTDGAAAASATSEPYGWYGKLKDDASARLALTKAGLWGALRGDDGGGASEGSDAARFRRATREKCGEDARGGALGLPMYSYRDAMADKDASVNVRDIARSAARDRRDFAKIQWESEAADRAWRARDADAAGGAGAAAGGAASLRAAAAATDVVARLGRRRLDDAYPPPPPPPLPPARAPPRKLKRLIATHHKTGTALMRDVFHAVGEKYPEYGGFADVRDVEDHPRKYDAREMADVRGKGIVLDYHLGKALPRFLFPRGAAAAAGDGGDGDGDDGDDARECASFPSVFTSPPPASNASSPPPLQATPYRMVHVVRDPVEVLVSGFLYHRRRPADEQWLFEPVKELRGKTYADHLTTANPAEAMMAELSMADDELRMLALAYRDVERDPNAMNVKLEEFFDDFDAAAGKVFRFLRFDERDIPELVKLAGTFDMRRWTEEELKVNEHFTRREDRTPYQAVVREDGFLNKTMSALRYALGYEDAFPLHA